MLNWIGVSVSAQLTLGCTELEFFFKKGKRKEYTMENTTHSLHGQIAIKGQIKETNDNQKKEILNNL